MHHLQKKILINGITLFATFFKDPATKQFNQRLKVASLLWKKVRISRGNKVYYHNMLEKYNKEIEIHKKG